MFNASRLQDRRAGFRFSFWLLLVVLAGIASVHRVAGQEISLTNVDEAFDTRDFDRMRWTLSNTSGARTKVDFSGGKLRIVVPAGPENRPIMGLDSRFGIEGDFDINVDYLVRSLPKPAKEWVNLSIFIMGPDGMAAMIRTNNSSSGDGYSLWFQPSAGSKAKGTGMNVPTTDRSGKLRLARIGKQVTYYAAALGKSFKEIGAVDFGDRPIDLIGFQILAPALKSPVDVEFDNIAIKADRFTKLGFSPPAESRYVVWIVCGVVASAGAVLFWWWKSARA
jgi:hypothetical protein